MPAKIRLQRHGKKGQALYHIVVADGRAPRDGKFIEKIGTYNPNTNPATIDLSFDRAYKWVKDGAQPTDTCKAILSYRGVLHKFHLYRGVVKGALTEEQMEAKFSKWLEEKESKITGKIDKLASGKVSAYKTRMASENAVREAKAAKIVAKNTPALEAEAPEAPEASEEQAPEAEA